MLHIFIYMGFALIVIYRVLIESRMKVPSAVSVYQLKRIDLPRGIRFELQPMGQ